MTKDKKILLIDDGELITRTLANVLERNGYEGWVAKNGSDGVVLAEEGDFDLIISDIRMPGIDGVETVRQILEVIKARGVKQIPAIFITGYADEKTGKRAQDLRPQAYIYKPFDYQAIFDQIKFALRE